MRAWCFAVLFPLCACNAVLGIEDLKVKPETGADRSEQGTDSSPDAGAKPARADSAMTSSGGSRAEPPVSMNMPVSGSKAPEQKPAADSGKQQPAAAGSAAMTTSAGQGAAGAKAEAAGPVIGTIIDYRGRKVPGVSVRVGTEQTTTDADGKFSVADAAASYDVTLLIQTTIRNGAASLVWQFQGLHRRDPTLQVYRGLPERYGEVMIHADNATFPLPSGHTIYAGWSSPDGDFGLELSSQDTHYLSPEWTGPAMTQGTAHALWVNTANGVPTEYFAHSATSVLMTADMTGQATFDLSGDKPATGVVSGTVTGHALGNRRNEAYLRFTGDNAALQLVNQWDATDSFMYTLPSLPDSKLTVVAKSVAMPGGMAAAYAEVEAGAAALALELPALPTLAAPDDGKANVDGSNMFQWNSDAHVFLLAARSVDYYDSVYVVTSAKQTRLPIGADLGYTPRANAAFEWSVEVHDAYASVDDATGANGFLSAYAGDTLRGPRRGAGTFAQSVPRVFTTPP